MIQKPTTYAQTRVDDLSFREWGLQEDYTAEEGSQNHRAPRYLRF
jgi:hypothetical protein